MGKMMGIMGNTIGPPTRGNTENPARQGFQSEPL